MVGKLLSHINRGLQTYETHFCKANQPQIILEQILEKKMDVWELEIDIYSRYRQALY